VSFQRRVEHGRYGARAQDALGVGAVAVFFVLFQPLGLGMAWRWVALVLKAALCTRCLYAHEGCREHHPTARCASGFDGVFGQ
jgi:hypothetical protein